MRSMGFYTKGVSVNKNSNNFLICYITKGVSVNIKFHLFYHQGCNRGGPWQHPHRPFHATKLARYILLQDLVHYH